MIKKIIIASVLFAAIIGLHFKLDHVSAATCLFPGSGGTGLCSATSSNVGQVIGVIATSTGPGTSTLPVYGFVTASGTSGGGGSSTNVFGANGVNVTQSGSNATATLDTSYSATWTALEKFFAGAVVSSSLSVGTSTTSSVPLFIVQPINSTTSLLFEGQFAGKDTFIMRQVPNVATDFRVQGTGTAQPILTLQASSGSAYYADFTFNGSDAEVEASNGTNANVNIRPLDAAGSVNIWSPSQNAQLKVGNQNITQAIIFFHDGSNGHISVTTGSIYFDSAVVATSTLTVGSTTTLNGNVVIPALTSQLLRVDANHNVTFAGVSGCITFNGTSLNSNCISSINGATSSAQTIAAGTGESVATVAGASNSTTTITLNINGGVLQTCTAGQAVNSISGVGLITCQIAVQTIAGVNTSTISFLGSTGLGITTTTNSVTFTNAGVTSFNGATGTVSGVNSFNGATGTTTYGVTCVSGCTVATTTTSAAITVTASGGSGTVTTSSAGVANTIPIWTSGSALGNSIITQSGNVITIGGTGSSTISGAATTTSNLPFINNNWNISRSYLKSGCAGSSTATTVQGCVQAITAFMSPVASGTSITFTETETSTWTGSLTMNTPGFTISLNCSPGVALQYTGSGIALQDDQGNPAGHFSRTHGGCIELGSSTLLAAGAVVNATTTGFLCGGANGCVGLNLHDWTINGFGRQLAIASGTASATNAYMDVFTNVHVSSGNCGGGATAMQGCLLYIGKAENSGEVFYMAQFFATDPGNSTGTNAIFLADNAVADFTWCGGAMDDAYMFIGISNNIVNLTCDLHIENSAYNTYGGGGIPITASSSGATTLNIDHTIWAQDSPATSTNWKYGIEHAVNLHFDHNVVDNYGGAPPIAIFIDHTLNPGQAVESFSDNWDQNNTLTNWVQLAGKDYPATCFENTNGYPICITVTGAGLGEIRDNQVNDITFDNAGNVVVNNNLNVGGALNVTSTATFQSTTTLTRFAGASGCASFNSAGAITTSTCSGGGGGGGGNLYVTPTSTTLANNFVMFLNAGSSTVAQTTTLSQIGQTGVNVTGTLNVTASSTFGNNMNVTGTLNVTATSTFGTGSNYQFTINPANAKSYVAAGSSTIATTVGGTLAYSATSTGNTGGSSTTLETYGIASGTWLGVGDEIDVYAGGTFASTAATNKQVYVAVASTTIFDTGAAFAPANTACNWFLEARGMLVANTTTIWTSQWTDSCQNALTDDSGDAGNKLVTVTTTIPINISLFGNGTNTSDTVANYFRIMYNPF